ncbi:MAG: hypothetical protein CVU38_19820 [Chloroflexi bacterium HGW-Chloroflexi-1]|nr:MAG: hypothetical protein CVU38_19820 [Chloroflexi bacterium HGW-Chloroflexi-1]
MWNAFKQPYVEAWESGHPWQAIGRGALFVGSLLIGTKGADKAAKALKAGEVAGKGGELAGVLGRLGKASRLGEVAAVADDIGRLGKATEIAEAAQLLARDARLAETVLQGAKSSDVALAMDAFKSAARALPAPEAAATMERFAQVTDAVLPDIMKAYGGPLGQVGEIPAELAGRRITTLGRFQQTVNETGSRILQVPDLPDYLKIPGIQESIWSKKLNSLWLREAIDNGDVIRLVTKITDGIDSLAADMVYDGISVYGRELNELLVAGYRRIGDYLIPP